MIFITYNGIGAFNWDVFRWNFFPSVKTKAFNVLGFRSDETRTMGWIYEYQRENIWFSFFDVTLIMTFKKSITNIVYQLF